MWGAAPRAPPSQRIEPAEADRIALTQKERRGLVERQAHNVGIGADDLDDFSDGAVGQPRVSNPTTLGTPAGKPARSGYRRY